MTGKLGLIAGGGALPIALAQRCHSAGRPIFIVRLKGLADGGFDGLDTVEIGIAELGRLFDQLKQAGCRAVCFAGVVKRPDFAALKPDIRGLTLLPGIIKAAKSGDDGLMRHILGLFEREGFVIEGAHEVDAGLTLPPGPLGRHSVDAVHAGDLELAVRVAKTIGEFDIGQAVVVVNGLVLAVEAQEGTAAMLARCRDLPSHIRGTADRRAGVLVKWPKPIQERRIDLPVFGAETVLAAASAGLAGIAGEAGGVLLLQRAEMIESANRLGLFVLGLPPEAP